MARVMRSLSENSGELLIISKNGIRDEHLYTGKISNLKKKLEELKDENFYGIKKDEEFESPESIIVEECIDNYIYNIIEPHSSDISLTNPVVIAKNLKETTIGKKQIKIIPTGVLFNLTRNNFCDIINLSLEQLKVMGKPDVADDDTIVVMEELIAIGVGKRATMWESGLETLYSSLANVKTSKSFWEIGQEIHSHKGFLLDGIAYITSIAPPIFTCLPFLGKRSLVSTILRNLLCLVHCHLVKSDVTLEVQYKVPENEKTSKNFALERNNLKAKQILFYVAGATIKSVCNSTPFQWGLTNTFAIKGTFEEIKQYLDTKLPDMYISAWVTQNNRGGLLYVNKTTFKLFQIIDNVASEFYDGEKMKTVLQNNVGRREMTLKKMQKNSDILEAFELLISTSKVPSDINSRKKILTKIFSTFLKLRGKGLQLYLRGKHFSKENKKQKSSPALRKGLKEISNSKVN